MINADDEVSLAYLLEPTFQVENTEGRPLTGGWVEVYLHGTRIKYYCYSDWNGSLHPFKIPLDSLGSNIVLASPAHSYDIYIYNKFGTLVMSRYNIVPSTGDGTVVIKNEIAITSEDNSVKVTESKDVETNIKKYDLSVNTDIIKGGNCIGVSRNDNNNVTISFVVTAGITDIELVNNLPAEPISTVLYLIPEES